eukprot:3734519-Pleurochrysis_carterae.AAC.1
MASSRSSCAASSARVRGKESVSTWLRTQNAALISTERERESAARRAFPIAASRFSSAVASATASAARPFAGGSSLALALRRLGQSRCQCVPPQCRHLTRMPRRIAGLGSVAWGRRFGVIALVHLLGNESAAVRFVQFNVLADLPCLEVA